MPLPVADARRLLAACGHGGGTAAVVDEQLARLAEAEGVAPALGYRIRREELACSDPAARDRLVGVYDRCKVRAGVTEVLLWPTLAGLVAAGIPVVLLKGAALARSAYRDIGERIMGDVDVLVPAAQWAAAGDALVRGGAVRQTCPARAVTVAAFHEAHFVVNGAVTLDLHRRLHFDGAFAVDEAGVIARSVALSGSSGARVPAAEDLLLHLATHAAQDGLAIRVSTLLDGLTLVAAGAVSADALVARASAWRATTAAAIFLWALVEVGLERDELRRAADELGSAPAVRRLARRAIEGFPGGSSRWRIRARALRTMDGTLRPLAFLARRGGLLAADIVYRSPVGRALFAGAEARP